jgi:luciferase family oxidoreductase group 1
MPDSVVSSRVPLSVLDLAMVPEGHSSAQALRDTTALAQRADALGYLRFWVAEHHNMGTVASTTPSVLMAHLASHTEHLRLGSGGVMLPNHAPLAIAEQFALLEALYPGRIDLGVGRAPGSDQATATALRRSPENRDAEDFPRHLLDVMGLLGDERTETGLWTRFRATPVATSSPQVFLLGSSAFSPQLAGMLGIPFVFANHFDMGGTLDAVAIYRNHFEPSPILDEPYSIVSAATIAAPTAEEAIWLSGPSRLRKFGMRVGQMLPLVSPEQAAAHPQFEAASQMPSNAVVGTPDEVVAGLDDLVEQTGASELMLYTATFGLAERVRSLELTATAWGLASR